MTHFWERIGFLAFLVKTFGPDGIFSNGAEGHAWLIGISEVIAFWPARHNMPKSYKANGKPIKKEYHYYCFGRACGVLAWIGIIALLKFTWLSVGVNL